MMDLDYDASIFTIAREMCARDNQTVSRFQKEHIKACLNECRGHYDILTIVPTIRVVTSFHLAWLRLVSAIGGYERRDPVDRVVTSIEDRTGGPVHYSVYPPVAPTGLERNVSLSGAKEQD